MKRPGISVILPCRDEALALPDTLEQLMAWGRKGPWSRDGVEILVVDDGSRDQSGPLAKAWGARVLRLQGLGYGGALKVGFAAAKGSWLAMMDADATYPPRNFSALWAARAKGSMGLINRFQKGHGMPWLRQAGNRVFSLWASWKTGLTMPDLNSGQRLFHRDDLSWAAGLPDGLDFSPAFTLSAARQGRVYWVPGAYEMRLGESKLSVLADGLRFAKAVIKY